MDNKLYVASVRFSADGKLYDYKVPPQLANTNLKDKSAYVSVRGEIKEVKIVDTKYILPSRSITYKYFMGTSDEYPE
jgi:hypothetical protein